MIHQGPERVGFGSLLSYNRLTMMESSAYFKIVQYLCCCNTYAEDGQERGQQTSIRGASGGTELQRRCSFTLAPCLDWGRISCIFYSHMSNALSF